MFGFYKNLILKLIYEKKGNNIAQNKPIIFFQLLRF